MALPVILVVGADAEVAVLRDGTLRTQCWSLCGHLCHPQAFVAGDRFWNCSRRDCISGRFRKPEQRLLRVVNPCSRPWCATPDYFFQPGTDLQQYLPQLGSRIGGVTSLTSAHQVQKRLSVSGKRSRCFFGRYTPQLSKVLGGP